MALVALALLQATQPDEPGEPTPEEYFWLLHDAVTRHWRPPPGAAAAGLVAEVRVSIGSKGKLSAPVLRRPSGERRYDGSCLAALAAIDELPPPPLVLKARFRRGLLLAFAAKEPPAEPELVLRFEGRPPIPYHEAWERFLPPNLARSLAETQELSRVSALKLAMQSFGMYRVHVGTAGIPTAVEVAKSGGRPLDRAARADLLRWRFRPYLFAGQRVPFATVVRLPLVSSAAAPPAPAPPAPPAR